MDRRIVRWELYGILFIIGFGTTLHFWFAWTGYWRPMAVVAAVNESTWEHFKMAFWPGLMVGILEYLTWGKERRDFFVAKFLGLLAMPIITMILFYGYTSIWHHSLPADIAVFVASVAGGQLISLFIFRKEIDWPGFVRPVAAVGLVVMTLAFATQSYFPRKGFLFEHPGTRELGILEEYGDHDHDDHDDDHDDED